VTGWHVPECIVNLSSSLYLSRKGEEELKTRIHKLGMKKRSLLILLDRPQIVADVLNKSVLQEAECLEELQSLLREGFISDDSAQSVQPTGLTKPAAAVQGGLYLVEEIVLSEAKFLLVDFCVDHFGTQSQRFVDDIRRSADLGGIRQCLAQVAEQVEKNHPKQRGTLTELVREINETA